MSAAIAYALTDEHVQDRFKRRLYRECWYGAAGTGPLLSYGWLHCYDDLYVGRFASVLHNPPCASPRAWRVEVDGTTLNDSGLVRGVQRLRVIEEVEYPWVTNEHCVRFALLCALQTHVPEFWKCWARSWLGGARRKVVEGKASTTPSAFAVTEAAQLAATSLAELATFKAHAVWSRAADAALLAVRSGVAIPLSTLAREALAVRGF
jgi:hypothetical protein